MSQDPKNPYLLLSTLQLSLHLAQTNVLQLNASRVVTSESQLDQTLDASDGRLWSHWWFGGQQRRNHLWAVALKMGIEFLN